eukprot:279742-Pyramimonas_sp.AAC.1
MEQPPWPRDLMSAGLTIASSTRTGASSVNLCSSIPDHVVGQPWMVARWWAKVASVLMCLMASPISLWKDAKALRSKPQTAAN